MVMLSSTSALAAPAALRLIVGLGNPGSEYAQTRHNIGFMVLDSLAAAYAIPMENAKWDCRIGQGRIEGRKLYLIKPMAFMNRSGGPVFNFMNYHNIRCEEMLIIHDDIDLAFGKLKIKQKGGHGGHNGLRSVIDVIGTDQFMRLRMGIGRADNVIGHVLGKFAAQEKSALESVLGIAMDAVRTLVGDGITTAMNRFNRCSPVETTPL
jgi:peptidyl-tRNA hydrolase, PTH1 family